MLEALFCNKPVIAFPEPTAGLEVEIAPFSEFSVNALVLHNTSPTC
jgi:hypothetical protein